MEVIMNTMNERGIWLTPEEHVERIAAQHFRAHNHPRRHIPIIWWDGHTWNMSVRDQNNVHHLKCALTWSEAKLFATAWCHINQTHGLTSTHVLAA